MSDSGVRLTRRDRDLGVVCQGGSGFRCFPMQLNKYEDRKEPAAASKTTSGYPSLLRKVWTWAMRFVRCSSGRSAVGRTRSKSLYQLDLLRRCLTSMITGKSKVLCTMPAKVLSRWKGL